MRSGWILLSLALSCLCGAAAAARSSSPTDDLYLDDPGSGGFYPEDDDDFTSGSGSGGGEEILEETVTTSRIYIEPKAAEPTRDSTKFFSPRMEPEGRARDGTARKPVRTEVRGHAERFCCCAQNYSLSAVIAGGVIGFLFAIFLILLLVYRMRKKDEGSYDLGERKPSGAAYQKAPTKEFYA
ncbi:syndecan-2 [Poecilia reticulata]|uniref:syndecan-2 n=1 Tax=Poecilia reticulata TaxID=8081 RepID=UPI0007EA46E7|nr:PREDICTED: syndecan-2-like [Poecilia reticulata]